MTLKDKVAVVTGGSSGIGAATVRMLAADGASVVICYNKGDERAEALLKELPKADHRTQHLAVEDSASVRERPKPCAPPMAAPTSSSIRPASRARCRTRNSTRSTMRCSIPC